MYGEIKVTEVQPVMVKTLVAAKMLGVSSDTIRDWVRQGRLKPTSMLLKRHYLFSVDYLKQWAREQHGEEEPAEQTREAFDETIPGFAPPEPLDRLVEEQARKPHTKAKRGRPRKRSL